MDLSMEQRLVIKFCFKAGKSVTETLQVVNAAYGNQALSHSNVFQWYGRFRNGQEDTEDDPRSGRPTESRNVIFFDWQGIIHKEFVPKGETINAVYYRRVMERLLNRI